MSNPVIPFQRRHVVPIIPAHPEIRAAQTAFNVEAQHYDALLAEAEALLRRAAELREKVHQMQARREWPFGGH